MPRYGVFVLVVVVFLAAGALLLLFNDPYRGLDFDPSVHRPAFAVDSPMLLVDDGHHNHHRISTTFRPFADLLRNDGFQVEALGGRVTREALDRARIFAIVTALADTEKKIEELEKALAALA